MALPAIAAPTADARRLAFGFNEAYARQSDGATSQEKLTLTAAAGGRLARTTLEWRCVEPSENRWNEHCWSLHEGFYARAMALGIRPVFSLIAAPDWARAHPCRRDLSSNCAIPPARSHDLEWREFAAEAARRFPEAVFEIWNEPNLSSFWNGPPDPARYAELVRLAYGDIKRASPAATVLAGGVVGTNKSSSRILGSSRFFRRAFRAHPDLRRHADGLSFHLYGLSQGLGRDAYFWRTNKRMRALARQYLPPKRRSLWITETGASTRFPESLTAREQRNRLWRAWRMLGRKRIFQGVIFHRLIQPKETSRVAWQYGAAWTRYRPLHERPALIQPRPVFCRFSQRVGTGYEPCGR